MSVMTFREAMQDFKDRTGWNSADIARHLGISAQSVSHWKRGRQAPGQRLRYELAALFGVSPRELAAMIDRDVFENRKEVPVNLRLTELEERLDGLERSIQELSKVVRRRARG